MLLLAVIIVAFAVDNARLGSDQAPPDGIRGKCTGLLKVSYSYRVVHNLLHLQVTGYSRAHPLPTLYKLATAETHEDPPPASTHPAARSDHVPTLRLLITLY